MTRRRRGRKRRPTPGRGASREGLFHIEPNIRLLVEQSGLSLGVAFEDREALARVFDKLIDLTNLRPETKTELKRLQRIDIAISRLTRLGELTEEDKPLLLDVIDFTTEFYRREIVNKPTAFRPDVVRSMKEFLEVLRVYRDLITRAPLSSIVSDESPLPGHFNLLAKSAFAKSRDNLLGDRRAEYLRYATALSRAIAQKIKAPPS